MSECKSWTEESIRQLREQQDLPLSALMPTVQFWRSTNAFATFTDGPMIN